MLAAYGSGLTAEREHDGKAAGGMKNRGVGKDIPPTRKMMLYCPPSSSNDKRSFPRHSQAIRGIK